MVKTPFAPETVEEGFDAVERLIYYQVHRFVQRYGGDFDELVGDAYEAFMKGHRDFVAGKTATGKPVTCAYPTVIKNWVWCELFDRMKVRLRRRNSAQIESPEIFDPADPCDSFKRAELTKSFVERVDALGVDGTIATSLLLYPPPSIVIEFNEKGGTPRNLRSTVRAYLAADLGWSAARITEAYADIKRVLGATQERGNDE